ncbi:hypothetical protein BDV10DRAFT_98174 [Aspergillus recurvatus]
MRHQLRTALDMMKHGLLQDPEKTDSPSEAITLSGASREKTPRPIFESLPFSFLFFFNAFVSVFCLRILTHSPNPDTQDVRARDQHLRRPELNHPETAFPAVVAIRDQISSLIT